MDFSEVDPVGRAEEKDFEAALRPKRLSEFEGQPRVRDQLGLVLAAARHRGSSPDHVLLSGPPGLGKTTLAMIIAAELGVNLRISSGPAIQHAGDLAAILSGLDEGDVLFFDEIYRLARPAEEMLYLAMEDFRVDVVVGKGPGATAIPIDLPAFTLVGATTRAGLLPGPLRDRFGFTAQLEFYEAADLAGIVAASATKLGIRLKEVAAKEIAGRSRGTPLPSVCRNSCQKSSLRKFFQVQTAMASRKANLWLPAFIRATSSWAWFISQRTWSTRAVIRANRLIRWWLWPTMERSRVRSWSTTTSRLCLSVSRSRAWINSSINISV